MISTDPKIIDRVHLLARPLVCRKSTLPFRFQSFNLELLGFFVPVVLFAIWDDSSAS